MEVTRENTLGIDLGTTYSTAVYEDSNGLLQNVDDGNGTVYIPSVVCGYNQLIVGCPAKKAQSLHPNSTAYEFKRLVARDYNDPVVERLKSQWPFKVVPNKKGIAAIQLEWQGENRVISPEELYNYLVEYICQCAENKTGRRFTNIVLTVPASFNSNQKQNIKNAVETTGRHVIDIIPEPTAAVISFAENDGLENEHVLVYDFGGGTFDVSILHIHDGIYDVLKEDGDPFLGGSDVNECLLHLFLRKIQEETKLEMNADRLSRRLRDTCEKCKQALSNNESWDDLIDLSPEDYAVRNESAPDMVTVKVDREEMNHEIMPIIGKTLEITERCVAKADLTLSQIGVVAMIGGSSNLDCAVKGVTALFPDAKIANYGDIRSAVARGAMLWGRQYFSETLVIGGNSSMRLVDDGGRMVFEKEPDPVTNVGVVEKPTNVAVVEKPTNVAVVEKPTNVAVVEKPTNVAVVEKPTNVTVTEEPTNVAVVEKPTNVAVVEKPTNVAVVEKPTNVTITEEPTNVAVADKPTDVTVTEELTNVAVTEEPTNVTVTEEPTNVAVTEKPTNVTVTEKPTNVAVTTTDMPTNVAVVAGDKPTNVVVVPPSTNVKLTPPPPKKPSQRNCLFINSPDAVISIQSENGTDVTGEIAFNGENYVYKQKDGDERVISNEGLQAICQSTILCLSSHDVRQRIETRDGRMNISVENGQLVVSSAADLRVSNISHTSFVAPPPGSPVSPGYPAIISRLNLSIGVATTDDVFSVIIKEGTELPASNTKHYRAASTTPTVIGFEVFQGDSSLCVNNQLIAKANVAGLRKQKKRNLGEVILRMEVDKHGIVSLQYRQPDEKTFRPLKTAVTKKLIIDDKEIEEIKKNADRTREKDCRLAKYRVLKESVGNLIVDYGSHPSHSDEVKKEWKQWVKAHACSKGAIPTTECVSEWEKKKEEIRCVIKQLK